MKINIDSVNEEFAVTSQLSPGDFAELAQRGIRSVINNRPDGEGGVHQPSDAALRAAADAAGLFYAYLPVAAAQFSGKDVSHMRALVGELPKPILAFCRTGTRSVNLYRAACRDRPAPPSALDQEGNAEANMGGIDRELRVVAGRGLIGATLAGMMGVRVTTVTDMRNEIE